ncbi:hypothetical protein Tco_1283716 [Tanacetum coccineum]
MCCQPLPPPLSPPSAKLMIMALEEYGYQSRRGIRIQAWKNGKGTSNGRGSHTHNTQYGRMSKIEFLKFHGEDVKGWVYRCKQLFKIDGIKEQRNVELASMHLYDQVLVWHQQYVKK